MSADPPKQKLRVAGLSVEDEAALEDDQDGSGAAEAANLSSGKSAARLKREARESQHNRNEALRRTFDNLIIYGMYFAATVFAITCFVWVLNLIMPDC